MSFATAVSGDGRSGLPNPRSMTSTPARRNSIFNASIVANAYGGSALIRRNSIAPGYRGRRAPRQPLCATRYDTVYGAPSSVPYRLLATMNVPAPEAAPAGTDFVASNEPDAGAAIVASGVVVPTESLKTI